MYCAVLNCTQISLFSWQQSLKTLLLLTDVFLISGNCTMGNMGLHTHTHTHTRARFAITWTNSHVRSRQWTDVSQETGSGGGVLWCIGVEFGKNKWDYLSVHHLFFSGVTRGQTVSWWSRRPTTACTAMKKHFQGRRGAGGGQIVSLKCNAVPPPSLRYIGLRHHGIRHEWQKGGIIIALYVLRAIRRGHK